MASSGQPELYNEPPPPKFSLLIVLYLYIYSGRVYVGFMLIIMSPGYELYLEVHVLGMASDRRMGRERPAVCFLHGGLLVIYSENQIKWLH